MIVLTLRSIARETRVRCLSFVMWVLFSGGKVSFSPVYKVQLRNMEVGEGQRTEIIFICPICKEL